MQRVIYAHGIHTGGGLTILKALLEKIASNENYCFILDARTEYSLKAYNLVNVEFFPAGIIGRLKSELFLRSRTLNIEAILSFNSLPFFLPVPIKTTVFFQNVNYVLPVNRTSIMPLLKRLLFRLTAEKVDEFVVQTETVARMLSQVTDKPLFMGTLLEQSMLGEAQRRFVSTDFTVLPKRFVYVADDSPHKNHFLLLKAWDLLYQKFPKLDIELYLTLPEYEGTLWRQIAQRFNLERLSVKNEGTVSRSRVFELYRMCDALVFPSLHESLGLPLLEAAHLGIDVIAPERDYVRDIVIPSETFDPQSYISIARALARYLGLSWPSGACPISAEELLRRVFDEQERSF